MNRTYKIELNEEECCYLADKIFWDLQRAKFERDFPRRRSKNLRLQLKENHDFLENLFLKISVKR